MLKFQDIPIPAKAEIDEIGARRHLR